MKGALKNKKMMFSFLVSDVLIKSGKFLALPLLLIYLSPSEFGQLEYYLSLASFFSSFLGPGLYNWLLNKKTDDSSIIFHSTLSIYLIWFASILAVTAVYSLLVQDYLLLVILVYSFSNSLYLFLAAFVKIQQRYKLYFYSAGMLFILDLSLICIFLWADIGFLSRILGSLSAFMVVFIVTYNLVWPKGNKPKKSSTVDGFKGGVRFFIPFFFFGVSSFLTTSYAKMLVGEMDGFARLASMGLALQILSILKLASDSIVKTINSIFIVSRNTHCATLELYHGFALLFIGSGYLFIVLLSVVEPWLRLDGYPNLLHDLTVFTPSRIVMVLNLYATIIITTLWGSKILYVSAFITIFAYWVGMPYVLNMGGIAYVANFDFFYNCVMFAMYNCYLLAKLNLERVRVRLLVTALLFGLILGYLLLL